MEEDLVPSDSHCLFHNHMKAQTGPTLSGVYEENWKTEQEVLKGSAGETKSEMVSYSTFKILGKYTGHKSCLAAEFALMSPEVEGLSRKELIEGWWE